MDTKDKFSRLAQEGPFIVRKQYHFRASARGLLAWDVDKLVALTADLQSFQLPLEAVRELDEPYWYSTPDSTPTCRSIADHLRLVEAADLTYPVIVDPDGRVMDGMHRIVKALALGRASVLAYRLRTLPAPDRIGVDPDGLLGDDG